MKISNKLGLLAVVGLIVVAVGISMAGIVPYSGDGVHLLTLSSTTSTYQDTGIALFGLRSTDSTVEGGLFLKAGNWSDTVLADKTAYGCGTPKIFWGSASGTAGTFYALTSDTTGKVTVSTTFSDSETSSGSWSSSFTSSSGSCISTFISPAEMSSASFVFCDSSLPGQSVTSALLESSDNISFSSPFEDTIFVNGFDTIVDKARIIVVAGGKIIGDTNMSMVSADNYAYVIVGFDSGVTDMYFIFWDASQAKYLIDMKTVSVGVTSTTITGGTGGANATNVGNITSVTLYVNPLSPAANNVAQVDIVDVANDAGPNVDGFVFVDSNTSGFDTRMPNTVFEINLYDTEGNQITSLPSGNTFLLVLQYGKYNSNYNSLKLLHLNSATNAWEAVSNSTADSTNQRIVAYVSSFSKFAIGNVSSSSSVASSDDNNCVVSMATSSTPFSGIMPTLRGMRDTVLGSSIGRALVSGYYGFAGLLLLAGAGLGLARMQK